MENENKALVSVDLGSLIAACAAAGCAGTVSISIFPKDEPPEAEPARYATLGGEADGAAGEEGRITGPRPTIPGKFMLGERVNYVAGIGADSRSLVGEVRGITHYVDREPAYFIRPEEEDQAQLGHDHDVSRDEGELAKI